MGSYMTMDRTVTLVWLYIDIPCFCGRSPLRGFPDTVLRPAAAVAAATSSRSVPFALGVATTTAATVAAAAAEVAAPLAFGVAGVVVAAAAEHGVLLLALRGGHVRHPQRGCFVVAVVFAIAMALELESLCGQFSPCRNRGTAGRSAA